MLGPMILDSLKRMTWSISMHDDNGLVINVLDDRDLSPHLFTALNLLQGILAYRCAMQ